MAVASLGVIGSATGFGVTSLDIPVTVNVPRSDPTLGGSAVLLFVMILDTNGHGGPGSVGDSAPTDPFYGTCLYTDGLNHYDVLANFAGFNSSDNPRTGLPFNNNGDASGTYAGLILNPLVGGVDTITLTFSATIQAVNAVAVAYTGLNTPGSSVNASIFSWLVGFISTRAYCKVESLDTTHTSRTLQWTYNDWGSPPVTGDPILLAPESVAGNPNSVPYPDYQWDAADPGTIIVYGLGDTTHGPFWPGGTQIPSFIGAVVSTGSSGAWSWGSGSIGTIYEIDDLDNGAGLLGSMLVAEQTGFALPLVGQDLSGSWSGIDNFFTFGGGALLTAGPGPSCPPPPPPTNPPVFNHRFRAGD